MCAAGLTALLKKMDYKVTIYVLFKKEIQSLYETKKPKPKETYINLPNSPPPL